MLCSTGFKKWIQREEGAGIQNDNAKTAVCDFSVHDDSATEQNTQTIC